MRGAGAKRTGGGGPPPPPAAYAPKSLDIGMKAYYTIYIV